MISKFVYNLWLIFLVVITAHSSFGLEKSSTKCEYPSEEKIETMSSKEIMKNFIQCMKDNTNLLHEKQQLTEKLQFIENDSWPNVILGKILMPLYMGTSVGLLVISGGLFYYSNNGRQKGFSLFIAGSGVSSIAAFNTLRQYNNNRMEARKEARKKMVVKDIKDVFDIMKNNNK